MTPTALRWGWLIVSAGLFCLLGYTASRTQTGLLLGLFGLLNWGYWLRVGHYVAGRNGVAPPNVVAPQPDWFLFGAAGLFRVLLLLAMPNLSDDYVRFVWDGRLLLNGVNPYLYLPRQLVDTATAEAAGLSITLFSQLNSPDYYTVYPPLNQALFALAAGVSGENVVGNIVALRLPILAAETGSLWLMMRLLIRSGRNPNLALLYGLNPLVILELTGNLHFEAVMIFFSLLAVWWLGQGRLAWSAGAGALAIGTKLLPLVLLPLAVRYLGLKRGAYYVALTLAFTTLLFLPFLSLALVRNVLASVTLYFQKFEFNASLYYVVRAVGYWLRGYNVIETAGRWLSVVTTLGVLLIAFWRWQPHSPPAEEAATSASQRVRIPVASRLLFTLTLYYVLATTVHPWYITTLVAAAVFSRYRYPLVWSAVIWLSYATYRAVPYTENLWLTLFEYAVVFATLVYDLYRPRPPAFTT